MRRLAFIALLCCACSLSATNNLHISGLGWLKDKRLNRQIDFLHGMESSPAAELDAAFIEDTAFLLFIELERLGYLRPSIRGSFTSVADASEAAFNWGYPYQIQVPADFSATKASFVIAAGTLFAYADVSISGLSAIDSAEARRFFLPGGALFTSRSDRAYNPANFANRSGRLIQTLHNMGYRDARLQLADAQIDFTSGDVTVVLQVEEGPLHVVDSITWHPDSDPAATFPDDAFSTYTQQPFTDALRHDLRTELLVELWRNGHADASVRVDAHMDSEPDSNGRIRHHLQVDALPGPVIELKATRFEQADFVARSVMRRQTKLQAGEPLSLLEVSEARRRLMGLGVFDSVEADIEPDAALQREAVFTVTPAPTRKLELLAGWGSYERARAGARWTQRNPFRRAHTYTLDAMVSMRAYRARLSYSIPQIFGTLTTAHITTLYDFREEPSFDRRDLSFNIGASSAVTRHQILLQYGYQIEQRDVDRPERVDLIAADDVRVASVFLRASIDRRDNPLYPTRGYHGSLAVKTAADWLGGSTGFQRFEARFTYHQPLSPSTFIHLGARFGSLYTWLDDPAQLPFSERFFPGGENSIRGYKEGMAGPLDASGDAVGARTQAVVNLELEQRLFSAWSVVLFLDSLGTSRDQAFSLNDQWLSSAGLGLRWRTVVGPVRFEYGHNLNRRANDPSGTFHFSIGFPF
jgi:outer membrane protein assembly factor BamA